MNILLTLTPALVTAALFSVPAFAQDADPAADEDSGFVPAGTMTRSSKHQKILQEKMRTLAREHPELLQALRKRHALDQEFKQARDNKYGERKTQ